MFGKRVRAALALAIVLNSLILGLVAVPSVGAATVVVTSATADWAFLRENGGPGDAAGQFMIGPGTPPIGAGSAELRVNNPSGGMTLGTGESFGNGISFAGAPLADIDTLSYSTYQQSAPATVAVALQFSIDYDPADALTAWQGRLVYEPYNDPANSVQNGQWQTWNTLTATARWWASGAPGNTICTQGAPCTWQQVLANWPNARIHPTLTQIAFKIGSNVNPSFIGNVDNFSITIDGANALFDFEVDPRCTTTCYVDAVNGDDAQSGSSPAEAKKTIQAGVDTVESGGTVIVAPGTYAEPITIDKALTLLGPNAGINPNTTTRGPEAEIVPNTDDPAGLSLISLGEDNITIDGFVLDGHNSDLPASIPDVFFNGVRVSAAFGITNDGAHVENLVIRNNLVQNLNYGVYLYNSTNIAPAVASTIANNRFENLSSRDGGSIGVLLQYNAFAAVTGNVMDRVYIGVYADQFYLVGPPMPISNNIISSYRIGIRHNGHAGDTSTFTVADNTVTTASYATWTSPGALPPSDNRNVGIALSDIQQNVAITVERNNVGGANIGIYGFQVVSSQDITVTGGTLSGNNYGVQLATCDASLSQYPIIVPFTPPSRLMLRDITIANSSIAGLAVIDDPTVDPVNCGTVLPAKLSADNVRVTGPGAGSGASGVLVQGTNTSLTLTGSILEENGVGLRVVGTPNGVIAANFNAILANGTGVNAPPAVNAENNWWGCNAGPGTAGCDTVSGGADFTPWLTLRLTRTPGGATAPGGTAFALTADLIINSAGQDTSGIDTVPNGLDVTFAIVSGGGTVVPAAADTFNGRTNATYTAGNTCGTASVSATSDDQTVATTVTLNSPCTPPPASPSPSPQVALTLTTSGTGTVTLAPPGGSFTSTTQSYTVNTVVTLTANPGSGQTFVGWTVDGAPSGWASPLTITMDAAHTVRANFVATKTFPDVGANRDDYEAITELASRGYILGYTNGNFAPDDTVLRAQMAALIARATPKSLPDGASNLTAPPNCTMANTWDCELWNDVTFTDLGQLDPNLKRDLQALAHYRVALGYGDGRYGPNDDVTYAQTISFITRAMVTKGYWQNQPDAPQPYGGVPVGHDQDVRTFVYYAGDVPEAPNSAAGWDTPATRGWFARALWAALDSYWGADAPLPPGDPAGGFQP